MSSSGVGAMTLSSTDWGLWPAPQHPTAPPEDTSEGLAIRDVHRRSGVIMGVVNYGNKKVWNLQWQYITTAEVSTLKDWWETGHFQFVYSTTNTGTGAGSSVPVYWTNEKFAPIKKRGDYYSLSAVLEEV